MGSPHPGTPGPQPGTPLGYPPGHPGNHPGGPQQPPQQQPQPGQPPHMAGPPTSMAGPGPHPGPMGPMSGPGTPGTPGPPPGQQMPLGPASGPGGPGGPGPGPGQMPPNGGPLGPGQPGPGMGMPLGPSSAGPQPGGPQGPGPNGPMSGGPGGPGGMPPGGHPGMPPGHPGGHPGHPGMVHPGGPGHPGPHPGHPGHPMTRMVQHAMPSPLDRDPTGMTMTNSDPRRYMPTTMSRRHTPYMGQPDYRIYELNKRLQQRTEESDNLWWDAFATEFFEDDATLTLSFCLEDGPKRYTIGRTLIPRYFRTIFEGGVTDLYYILKHPKESFHNTTITLDCDQAMMVTHHGKPMFTKVVTEGRLILEFTFDDLMRIRSWHFATRQHRELIPRSVIAMQQDPAMVEQLSKNITRQGLTNHTLNFLRLCVILEPMQELMSRHKAYGLNPRDCLKTTLFQKWQRMVAPPETNRQPSKRRKRKSSTSTANSVNNVNAGGNAPGSKQKRSPGPQAFNPVPGDVMVVGEPALMGGEFGDEDERLITRLENTQYEPNGENDDTNPAAGGAGGTSSGGPGGPGDPQGPHHNSNQFQSSSSLQSGGWQQQDKKPPTTSAPPTDDIKKE